MQDYAKYNGFLTAVLLMQSFRCYCHLVKYPTMPLNGNFLSTTGQSRLSHDMAEKVAINKVISL